MAYINGKEILFSPNINYGYDEGFEAGKTKEWSDFWDAYQRNGTRTNYERAFTSSPYTAPAWNNTNFKPKYDLKPVGTGYMMFYFADIEGDFVELCEKLGITFDTSEVTNFQYMLTMPKVTRLGVINMTKCGNQISQFVWGCFKLHTIDEIIVNENTKFAKSNSFTNSSALVNLKFTGTLAQNGLDVSDHKKLTHESLMSIINVLKDYSTDTSGTTWVVTLGSSNLAKLSEEEKAIATEKGWTLA